MPTETDVSSVRVLKLETFVEVKVGKNGVANLDRVAKDLEKLIPDALNKVYAEKGLVTVKDTYSTILR